MTMVKTRRVVFWIVVIFIVYAIFRNPEQAAQLVRGAFDGIAEVARGIGRFFNALLFSGRG